MDLRLARGTSISSYRALLGTYLGLGFEAITHAEWFVRPRKSRTLLVRHDVDHDLETGLLMAQIEADMGVRSSYYLLPPGDYNKSSNYYGSIDAGRVVVNPRMLDIAAEMQKLGHEVGIHNDFIQLGVLTGRSPGELLAEQIDLLRREGIRVFGTASHGSRFARERNFVNYKLFSERPARPDDDNCSPEVAPFLHSVSYRSLGLIYEAYEIAAETRLADSGGNVTVMMNSPRKVDTISGDLDLEWLQLGLESLSLAVILIHPDHWSEGAKAVEPTAKAKVLSSGSGKPLRISVRGDCTSRRAIALNRDLFPDGVKLTVNGKSPNILFADASQGKAVTEEMLMAISNVDDMPKGLRGYYLGQADRSILEQPADLLVMDSYADMNFELWEHSEGWKIWIHPKYLKDSKSFYAAFKKLGRRSLDEAVDDAVATIEAVRKINPGVPVLFLSQQVEYYDKLHSRREFYELGEKVAARTNNVFVGDIVPKSDLGLADVGSCGPGQTLHYDGPTYRRMMERALERGLADAVKPSARKMVAPSKSAPLLNSTATTTGPTEKAPSERSSGASSFSPALRSLGRVVNATWLKAKRSAGKPAEQSLPPPVRVVASDKVVQSEEEGDLTVPPPELAALQLETAPRVRIDYGRSAACSPACEAMVEANYKTFNAYFTHADKGEAPTPKRYTPMLIQLGDRFDFEKWEQELSRFGKGARLRQKRKAEQKGFYVKPFAWRLHIPDVHEINHSKEERSGGKMRGGYVRSVEEMGGAPAVRYEVAWPRCPKHWALTFGTFVKVPGYSQGSVEVGEKLIAYISLRRTGDVALYSQIMGHGDYLGDGALTLLHHEVIRWLSLNERDLASGLRYVMYGGAQNGGQPLYQWKRQAGFRPALVEAYSG